MAVEAAGTHCTGRGQGGGREQDNGTGKLQWVLGARAKWVDMRSPSVMAMGSGAHCFAGGKGEG